MADILRTTVTYTAPGGPVKPIPDVGGRVDAFRVLAYPWDGDAIMLDEVIISFTWSEDANQAAVSGDLVIDNIGDVARRIAPGSWLVPQFLDPISLTWHDLDPPLYVWSRSLTDLYDRTSTISALDIVSFLQRQGSQNWFFRDEPQHSGGWTASQIAEKIAGDLGIEATFFPTKYKIPYLFMQSHTPYDAIVKAYTRDRQISAVRYRIQAIGRKVVVQPFLSQDRVWRIAEGSNLNRAEWTESLDNLYTQIVLISSTTKSGAEGVDALAATTTSATGASFIQRGMKFTSPLVDRYGIIRNVIVFDKELPPEAMKFIGQNLIELATRVYPKVTIEAEGLMPLRAGDVIWFQEGGTNLMGDFFVSSISHSITSGNHSMSIELSYTDIVPLNYPTRQELVPASDKPLIGSLGTLAGPLGVAWFPPGGTSTDFKVIGKVNGTGPHALGGSGSAPDWKVSSAVDIKLPVGTIVYAAFNGTITGIGHNPVGLNDHFAGWHVGLQSEIGKPSAYYAHLQTIDASLYNGKKVKLGDPIGTVGIKDAILPNGQSANYYHFALSEGSYADKNPQNGIDPLHWFDPKTQPLAQESNPATVAGQVTAATAISSGLNPAGVPAANDNAGILKMTSDLKAFVRQQQAGRGGVGVDLAGHAQEIVQLGIQYGVDPRLCVAIAGIESGFGTSSDAIRLNNCWGLGPHIQYSSLTEGIAAFYRSVTSSAYGGAKNVAGIMKHYNPSNWMEEAAIVIGFMTTLGADNRHDVIF